MLKIETTEIKMWDKHVQTVSECTIRNGVFSCLCTDQTTFHSELFKYEDVFIAVNRENRFGEFYYNIVAYDEVNSKVWPIVTLPSKFDISLRRLSPNVYIVWSDSKDAKYLPDMKQCSFCRLHDTEKVDNVTIDFNNLRGIDIIMNRFVLIAFSQTVGGNGGIEKKDIYTLSLYEASGKLFKTFYEFDSKSEVVFEHDYRPETLELVIIKKDGDKPKQTIIKLDEFCADAANSSSE